MPDFYDVGDVTLAYEVHGQGHPILLLHGFPDSRKLWRFVTPGLVAAGYQVIAMDLPGYGDSSIPDRLNTFAVDAIAQQITALLDHLQVRDVHLVGHDWGTVVAWQLAAHHAEYFASLTALSVGHPEAFIRAGWKQMLNSWYMLLFSVPKLPVVMFSAFDWSGFKKMVPCRSEHPVWLEDMKRPGRLQAAFNIYRANLLKMASGLSFPAIPLPVHGIWSSEDEALREEQMAGSANFVEGQWHYSRIEDCGHWIPVLQPEALIAAMLPFWQKLESVNT